MIERIFHVRESGSTVRREALGGDVNRKDPTEYLPAFLPMVVIPFSFKIHEGIAFGFISYSLLKLVTGRAREGQPILHVLAALFLLRYLFLKGE